MAITLEGLRSESLTNIRGRRLGLDHNEFMVGPKDLRKAVSNATSDTTGTALVNYGFHTVTTTTNDTWTLSSPTPGVEVMLMTGSSSTGTHTITPTNATIISTNGVAGASIAMQGAGAHLRLIGISTGQWAVTSIFGSTTALYASVTISS